MGFHNVNPLTGDFALEIQKAFLVEQGEKTRAVNRCMLMGNFFDILNHSDNEFSLHDSTKTWLIAPHLKYSNGVIIKG